MRIQEFETAVGAMEPVISSGITNKTKDSPLINRLARKVARMAVLSLIGRLAIVSASNSLSDFCKPSPLPYAPYTVVSGDNLSNLAKTNNTSVNEILKYNPEIINLDYIQVDQIIKIPKQ